MLTEGQPSWLSVSPLQMQSYNAITLCHGLSRFVTAYHVCRGLSCMSRLVMYVASARVPESACMRELLGLYLLYRLTWHRMAKLRTVKSGVQALKDGGARARVGCS